MSILSRYKKPGGFRQLLQLVETSQPTKQAKLIEVIKKEDPHWAKLIIEKKISPDMVLAWPPEHLATVFEYMTERHCASLLKAMDEEQLLIYFDLFKPEKTKSLRNQIDDIDEIKSTDTVNAHNNLLETVRFLDEEKKIILRFIDPNLDLSEAA